MRPAFEAAVERLVRVRGVRGALVADATDGLPVTGTLRDGEDAGAVAALAAAVVQRLMRAGEAAGVGAARLVHLRGEDGLLVAAPVAESLLLVVLTDRTANLGLVRLALFDAAGMLQS